MALKNGYVYIYVSDESPVNVFFDNLQVVHTRGAILEETHYYPYGLTMNSISSKALAFGSPENKRGFHGKEIQNREFSDGSGLEIYDFGSRDQELQIGRWWTIDPKAGKYFSSSSYNFVDNNPISRVDPTGQNWFYYQAEGEKQKSWHWQKGSKATYTDVNGKSQTIKSNFTYLVKFVITDRDWISGAKARGDLIVYGNSDKPIFTSRGFSGQKNLFSRDVDELPKGNYIMNLSLRNDGKNIGWNAAKDGPAAFMGIQKIPENTILRNGKDGDDYNVNDHYGGGRIRLNPPSGNLVAEGQSTADMGFYLHGRDKWLDETHGCICNRSLEVFNYFWSGAGKDVRGSVPFSVEDEK